MDFFYKINNSLIVSTLKQLLHRGHDKIFFHIYPTNSYILVKYAIYRMGVGS